MTSKKLNAVVTLVNEPQAACRWGVQALEYDIYTEGDTLNEALENFGVVLTAEAHYCARNSLTLEALGEAPAAWKVPTHKSLPLATESLHAALAAAWPTTLTAPQEIEIRLAA